MGNEDGDAGLGAKGRKRTGVGLPSERTSAFLMPFPAPASPTRHSDNTPRPRAKNSNCAAASSPPAHAPPGAYRCGAPVAILRKVPGVSAMGSNNPSLSDDSRITARIVSMPADRLASQRCSAHGSCSIAPAAASPDLSHTRGHQPALEPRYRPALGRVWTPTNTRRGTRGRQPAHIAKQKTKVFGLSHLCSISMALGPWSSSPASRLRWSTPRPARIPTSGRLCRAWSTETYRHRLLLVRESCERHTDGMPRPRPHHHSRDASEF